MSKEKFLFIIGIILLVPIVGFEYFGFLWFWFGDGEFNRITVPLTFIVILILHIVLINKYKEKKLVSRILKFSTFAVNPLLTMVLVEIIAKIIGVDITIMMIFI
jgi:hypothetical protein